MSDGWMKIVLYTPELSVEDMTSLLQAKKQWIADEIEFDAELWKWKTPWERLRAVLFLLYENEYKNKFKNFNEFYPFYMETIIDKIKEKLPARENDFTN